MALNARTTPSGKLTRVRRTLILAMLVTAVGALAAGAWAMSAPANEGTLSIKRGDGTFMLHMRGAAVGRLGSGVLLVGIPVSRSCEDVRVWGEDEADAPVFESGEDEPGWVCGFSGDNMRFRLSGRVALDIFGKNLFLSAAGRGELLVQGDGGRDGLMSVNGRKERGVPDILRSFAIEPDSSALKPTSAE